MKLKLCLSFLGLTFALSALTQAQDQGIDPEALIERILSVDKAQREQLQDVTFDAELVTGEMKKEGFEEKERFTKKIYFKYEDDTVLFYEEYLEYYKEGEKQSDKDRDKKAKERKEKAEKRKTQNVSFPMLRPFTEEERDSYSIEYHGVTEERIDGYLCHEFKVEAKEDEQTMIDGTYYFEADGFHLVRCNFQPAKLAGNLMFKMKEMNMSIQFSPTESGVWLPSQFDIQGKGKAAFLFGVNFAATEQYRNPEINTGVDDSLFEEPENE